jgi:magnesium and cobalt transporter
MVVIKEDSAFQDILPIITESAHSRFPVIAENRDEVVGLLLAKELLKYYDEKQQAEFSVKAIMRPPVFVAESKRLDILLREFRLNHNHMALVIDEYGGVAGLITIEDVLEQIVGEIEDEYDEQDEFNIKQHTPHEYIIKALTPIEDFNEYFSDHLSAEEYDTIGGLVMSQFGHLPKQDEETSIGRYDFKIMHADKRRIHLLRVKLHDK